MQQAEISLPPLSVLLKEGLKGSKTAEGRRDTVQQNGSAVTAKECPSARDSLSVPLVKVKTDEVVKVRTSKDTMDVTLFPRRKAGENSHDGARGPVVLSVDLLKTYFGVPLHVAAKKLGICQTAIKKVCRRLGIKKWPYKDTRVLVNSSSMVVRNEDTPRRAASPNGVNSQSTENESRASSVMSRQSTPPTASSVGDLSDPEAPQYGEEEVVTAVHALLSLNMPPAVSESDAQLRVAYVDLIRNNGSVIE
mmetsp:Transcript_74966/g.201152  ORF Transcript_74966/g.201152 Transcript_74966/m.201152 type:complete len:250 (+) Transcript_74966:119-868(+)